MTPNQISAFIICKNEEKVIERALKSLSWADEIIIVDSQSSDKTLSIAEKYTSLIFQKEWADFGDQRNFALQKTKYPWVFYLDADEVCSPELIDWLKKFKTEGEKFGLKNSCESPSVYMIPPQNQRVDLYEIRRFEHFQGVLYKYGAGNPSHQWRLFRREGACFVGDVHEYIQVPGLMRRIETPILHFPKASLSDIVDKMNRYSTLEAEQLYKKNIKHNVTYMFFSGLAMFLKSYFRKQGFRDGILGFILAVMDGGAFFLRQAKLYLKHRLG